MEEKMTRDDMLFFGAYILYIMVAVIKPTQLFGAFPFPGALELLRVCAVVIVCFKIISNQEYISRETLVFYLAVIITFISCMHSKNFDLFYFVCFSFGIKDISYSKVLRVTLFVHIIVIIMVVIGVSTGIISNEIKGDIVWSETMIDSEFVERNTLGFGHPNTASAVVFFTTIIYMCVKNGCSFLEFIISFGINFMVYQKTGSRTCFIITIIFLPLMYWFANKKTFHKYWQVLLTVAPVIIILVAILMQIYYDPNNEFFVEINSLLSSRLQLGHQGFLDYGITLFGQSILWISDWNNEYGLPYNYVDSAYMRILLENGIIVYIFLCIFIVITMYYLAKKKERMLCIAFLALLVHSMVEMSLYDLSWSPFCLLIGQMAILDSNKE